jgi:N-formylglutamate amidohydrolase
MGAGWKVTETGQGSSPLVVHVPHSSTWLPDAERRGLLLDDAALEAELRSMTDWHTDRIALDALNAKGLSGKVFVNNVSRLVVDPERFPDDTEPMETIGMGPVYRVASDLSPLRHPGPVERERLLDAYFFPYGRAFTGLVDQTLADFGEVVILDLHSFPSLPLPYEVDQAALRPGICVGTDAYHTSPDLIEAAFDVFTDMPGGVAENSPFSGTYVPLKHWRQTPTVRSMMIEVRRDLYQIEPGGPVHEGYGDVVERVSRLFSALAGSTPTGSKIGSRRN